MKGLMLIIFFFKRVNTKDNPFIFVTRLLQISHGYCRRICVMFTMPRKVVQHVDWPSVVVLSPPV